MYWSSSLVLPVVAETRNCFLSMIIPSLSDWRCSAPCKITLWNCRIPSACQHLVLKTFCLQIVAPFGVRKVLCWCFNRGPFWCESQLHSVKNHSGSSFLWLCLRNLRLFSECCCLFTFWLWSLSFLQFYHLRCFGSHQNRRLLWRTFLRFYLFCHLKCQANFRS